MTDRDGEPEPTRPYLAEPAPPSGESPPAPTAPYQPSGPVPPPAYGAMPYLPPFRQPHPHAGTAMVLGIVSLVCALGTMVVCVSLPGFLCGPFAIALALRAQRDMRDAPGAYSNEGAAMTGLVTGIIGTVVGLAMTVGLVLFFGFFLGIVGLGSNA